MVISSAFSHHLGGEPRRHDHLPLNASMCTTQEYRRSSEKPHLSTTSKKIDNSLLLSNTHAKSLSHVQLFATPWTAACQAPRSMGFSKQEYWSGCHFLLEGIFLIQGLNLFLLQFLHLQAGSLSPAPPEKPHFVSWLFGR